MSVNPLGIVDSLRKSVFYIGRNLMTERTVAIADSKKVLPSLVV